MAEINPYLIFNGDCAAAFDFYRSVFGGDFSMRANYSEIQCETPPPESEGNLIMHVSLPIGSGTILMGSDCPPSQPPVESGNSVMLAVAPVSKGDADRIFAALSEGGAPKMPMQDMFWGGYFGMLTDRFGINWQINFDTNQAS